MMGNRDTLLEQPARHFNVAALRDRSSVNAHTGFEELERWCRFVREPPNSSERLRARE
jgi:hypothetical protein